MPLHYRQHLFLPLLSVVTIVVSKGIGFSRFHQDIPIETQNVFPIFDHIDCDHFTFYDVELRADIPMMKFDTHNQNNTHILFSSSNILEL